MARQYGGFDEEFVDEVKDTLICNICVKPLRDPHLTVCCGHHLCESCLEQWLKKQHKQCCPICRSAGEKFQHFLDKKTKREINALRVKCSNCKEGCEWVGELGTLKNHLGSDDGCGYVSIMCPNGCYKLIEVLATEWVSGGLFDDPLQKENIFVLRKDLQHHLKTECEERPYQCEHCDEKGTFNQITNKHYQQCPDFPLDCPNQCGIVQIKRTTIDQHRKECPLEIVSCPFEEVGCRPMCLRRKDEAEHMEKCVVNHQLLMFKSNQEESERAKKELNQKMAVIVKNIDSLLMTCTEEQRLPLQSIHSVIDDSCCLKQDGAPLSLKLDFPQNKQSNNVWYSPPFHLGDMTGLKLRLRVYPNGIKEGARTHVSLVVECLERDLKEPIKVECGCVKVQAIISKKADILYDTDCVVYECNTTVRRDFHCKYGFVPLKNHTDIFQ